MTKVKPFTSIMAEVRIRLSRSSSEMQTGQSQVMTGTPMDVPVPKNVIFNRLSGVFGIRI
jgi:hypothetical protein